jgi:hypothetical protein
MNLPGVPSAGTGTCSWNVTPAGFGGSGIGVSFGVGSGGADGNRVAGGAVSAGVAFGVIAAVDDIGVSDGVGTAAQATRITVSATVELTRRIEAGIEHPPNGLLP